jgi:hypothetical protein
MKKLIFLMILIVVAGCSSTGQGKKSLSANEKSALEYVEVFVNGSDKAAKEKFVADKVHPDIAPIFKLGIGADSTEKVKNPRVMESVSYEANGLKGETVLVQGDEKKEMIVLLMEGKVGFIFRSDGQDADAQKNYSQLRAQFKTAAPK